MQKNKEARCPQRYLTQINAFERWLTAHYLPTNAQLLWYKMIALFNGCDWPASVQVDSRRLAAMIAKTEKTALLARDKLVEAGLLRCEQGGRGCPTRYEMLWFSDKREENDSQVDGTFDGKNSRDNTVQSTDINRIDIDKTRQENKTPAPLRDAFASYAQMRRKIRRPMTADAERMILRELEEMAPSDLRKQRAILDQSVMHGWSGVFPLREKKQDADHPPASYDIDEMEKRLLYGKIEYRKRE